MMYYNTYFFKTLVKQYNASVMVAYMYNLFPCLSFVQ